jgi:16S rRNA (guanine527-N7)-methyltransferase
LSHADARAARDELDRLVTDTPFDLPDGFADAVEHFVSLLLDANRRLNLTRVVEPTAVARLHLLDSLAALPLIDGEDPTGPCLDLGSGGGVPGLVLALARPSRRWVLVDSVRKKADAMREFVRELGLANIEVLAERAEDLGRDAEHRERYAIVTARACAALPVLAEYALPLIARGGRLLAWKGPIAHDELRLGAAASRVLGGGSPDVIPAGFAELGDHRFVMIRKTAPTPSAYPRRPGEPSRRPLG